MGKKARKSSSSEEESSSSSSEPESSAAPESSTSSSESSESSSPAAAPAPRKKKSKGGFSITTEELVKLVDFDNRESSKQVGKFNKYGGTEAVCDALDVDPETGITKKSFQARRDAFGENRVPMPDPTPFWYLIWDQVKSDILVQILIAAAIVNVALGIYDQGPEKGWYDGAAIMIAVTIVLGVTAVNDWKKERQFRKILALQSAKKVYVRREGQRVEILSPEILVGDRLELEPGVEVPADGVLLTHDDLKLDESPLTGETIPVTKDEEAPFLFAGSTVSTGSGSMIATTIGANSTGGQIQALLAEEQNEQTPLQVKLERLAKHISIFSFVVGAVTLVALLIRLFFVIEIDDSEDCERALDPKISLFIEYFILSVTIVVVAVPEGLPVAVVIALAYSVVKMVEDKNFVRHLAASETMGGATVICSDKTGTLTENRMTVTQSNIGGLTDLIAEREAKKLRKKDKKAEGGSEDVVGFSAAAEPIKNKKLSEECRSVLIEALCANSTADLEVVDNVLKVVGNKTEGALIMYAQDFGVEYGEERKKAEIEFTMPFNANRKRMTTVVRIDGSPFEKKAKLRAHTKGAAEIVLGLCTHQLHASGDIAPLGDDDRQEIEKLVSVYANQGLRAITLAFRDFSKLIDSDDREARADDAEQNLVFLGVVGIKDPVRPEVPPAVKECQAAGLMVKMVTGDNPDTARHISKECGIYDKSLGHTVMVGPDFRALSEKERDDIVENLAVLARSSPQDKYILVQSLKRKGHVVAVTGDGTNDAPALKAADVGFSMGLAGTDTAKNASDIVLLDDNFASIVRAIIWGRNVFDCVRKFLQFQLSVNFVAIIAVFTGAAVFGENPLTPVQLLWTNLIMDTLGALALATDEPTEAILNRPPHRRTESLITWSMVIYISIQTLFQTIIVLGMRFYFEEDSLQGEYDESSESSSALLTTTLTSSELPECPEEPCSENINLDSLIFSTFILLQVFNEINARALGTQLNPFHRILHNKRFVGIMVVIVVVQVLVVSFGGDFTCTRPMAWQDWLLAFGIGASNLIVGVFTRLLLRIIPSPYGESLERGHSQSQSQSRDHNDDESSDDESSDAESSSSSDTSSSSESSS